MGNRLNLPKVEPTAEAVYWNRRQVLKALGFGAAAAGDMGFLGRQLRRSWAAPAGVAGDNNIILRPGVERVELADAFLKTPTPPFDLLPDGGAQLTDPLVAATHNNYYEFTTNKQEVWRLCKDFQVDPWQVEVGWLCHKPQVFDLDDLFKFELEERVYRFRCVEAWAMDVSWMGFELGRLLSKVEPKSDAKFVRFTCAAEAKQMPGIASQPHYPCPYFEALSMDEALNPLTLMALGIYGRPLPRQHGSPLRIITPWKYGFKQPKAIVKIELVEKQPQTFWHQLQPREYGFVSNIDPQVPHARWSQAMETVIGTNVRRPTLAYGGYGKYVAHIYQ